MLQPSPSTSHLPHFRPPLHSELPKEGDLPVVSKEQLERSSAFARQLANADFVAVVAFLQDKALSWLSSVQPAGKSKDLRAAQAQWRFALEMTALMQSEVSSTEAIQQERARQSAALKAGKPVVQGID